MSDLITTMTAATEYVVCKRGNYNEITIAPPDLTSTADALIVELGETGQIEKRYVDFDRKGRGSALNYDLYGYDQDASLYVFQARQAYRRHKNDYLSTRKTYALAGRNENGSPFWHPISSGIVHAAIRANADDPTFVVQKAMAWIFELSSIEKLGGIVRQGDVALIPAKPRGTVIPVTEATLADTHILSAVELRDDRGTLYALDPAMRHSRAQHADIAASGWYRVTVGRTYRAWDFSPRSID